MTDQLVFFAQVLMVGAAAGLIYDFFRILRRTFRHVDALTQAEDVVYWLLATVFIFYFILHSNNGEIRLYAVVGVFGGMGLYFFTLSRLLMAVSGVVIDFLKRVILTVVGIILIPIKLLIKALSYPAKYLMGVMKKSSRHMSKTARLVSRRAKYLAGRTRRDLHIIRKMI
ncbi:MAG: spore cortex biosynthesis protein YabQ [Clostridiales bacterium]|jgi:spore cortex biosynthesis protein YabQ|nr:spore cortex biosynthesis protein YabQ [Clostridiales bacterium]